MMVGSLSSYFLLTCHNIICFYLAALYYNPNSNPNSMDILLLYLAALYMQMQTLFGSACNVLESQYIIWFSM